MLKQLAIIACILACGVDVNASPVSVDKDEYTLVIAHGGLKTTAMVSAQVIGLDRCRREGRHAAKELKLFERSIVKFYCVKTGK